MTEHCEGRCWPLRTRGSDSAMPGAAAESDAAASRRCRSEARATAAFLLCAVAGRVATAGLPIGLVVQASADNQPAASTANTIAIYTAVAALNSPLIGRLNDRGGAVLGRYRLGLSLFVLSVFYLSVQTAVDSIGSLVAAAAAGLALPLSGSAWSGAAAKVLLEPVSHRLRSYDVGSYAAAALAAPLAVGSLAPLLGRHLPLLICAGFAAVAVIFSSVLKSANGSMDAGPAPLHRHLSLPKRHAGTGIWPFLALVLVTMGIQPIAIALTLNAPFFGARLYGSYGAAGLVLATLSFGTLLSSLNAHRRILRRISTLAICGAVVSSAIILPVIRPGWLGIGCLLFIGIGNGLLLVATLARVDTMFSGRVRFRIFAVTETSRMLAGSAAAWALGAVSAPPRESVVISALPIVCTLPLLLSLKLRRREHTTRRPPMPLEE